MEDTSLDEFLGDGEEAVDPAEPTSRYDPDGAVCEACGETVTRRWHEDDNPRCRDCKSW